MEWPLDDRIVTVVSFSTGEASIYTTASFGAIGGGDHEKVRAAAIDFVKACEKFYSDAVPAAEHAYPQQGRIRFFLRCFDGLRLIDADLASVASGNDKYSDLLGKAQNVVTGLRLIAQSQS